MARRRRPFPVLRALFFVVSGATAAGASCRGGCVRGHDRTATVEGRLALFPAAAQVVISFDFAKLRESPAAAKLAALAEQSQSDQREIETFAHRTGFDPVHDVDTLLVAFPDDARRTGALGLVMRGNHLDETRLVAYARDELRKGGDDLVGTAHGSHTLWSSRRDPDIAGFFLDARTFVLGAGGWAPRMADLANAATARASDSAATNLDLVRMAEQAAGAHAIWGAAIVPEETRRKLRQEPRFANAAAVQTLALGLDVGRGLEAVLLAEVETAPDAQGLARKVQETLRDAKKNAQVLMLGLGPYLDGVTARAINHTFELRASLTEPQLDDLIARLGAFVNLARQGRAPGFGR